MDRLRRFFGYKPNSVTRKIRTPHSSQHFRVRNVIPRVKKLTFKNKNNIRTIPLTINNRRSRQGVSKTQYKTGVPHNIGLNSNAAREFAELMHKMHNKNVKDIAKHIDTFNEPRRSQFLHHLDYLFAEPNSA
jgi:hypothetical protein